jgi:hypothetical protein
VGESYKGLMTEKSIPIILLVSERSGSNLLRTLLGNHRLISSSVAPHFMSEFYSHRHYYRDLRNANNFQALCQDMIELANHPYHDWNLAYIQDEHGGSSFVDAFNSVYSAKAREEGKVHYCSKGINTFKYIDILGSGLTGVKFIHLVRDPRDHVASWLKRPIRLLSAYDAALKWKDEQASYVDAVSTRNIDSMSIQYEDLILDTKSTILKVFDHLGLDAENACFGTEGTEGDLDWNTYWENLSKPVMKENAKKYKTELSVTDINIIEAITRPEMDWFGYGLETKADWKLNRNSFKYVVEQRKTNKVKADSRVDESLRRLQEKWNFINSLLQDRSAVWQGQYERFDSDPTASLPLLKSPFRSRLKYFLFALFGESLTNKFLD